MYDRQAAVEYAHKWAFSANPDFYDFSQLGGDCTNFASQVIYAGCPEMNYTPTFGWYYISLNNRSPSWTGVNELFDFLTKNTSVGPSGRVVPLSDIQNGDIIQLNFGTSPGFDHSPVVVDRGSGTPDTILVAAHSRDSDYRPLSTYSYAEIRPIHIECHSLR